MSRKQLDKVVKEWEKVELIFKEHECISGAVFPGKSALSGLHGILRNKHISNSVRVRLKEAMTIAKENDLFLFVSYEVEGLPPSWGGERKLMSLFDIEIAIIPKEVFVEMVVQIRRVRNGIKDSYSYLQEDDEVLWVEEKLGLLEARLSAWNTWFLSSLSLESDTERLRPLLKEIMDEGCLEDVLREQLDGQLQREAATIVCEGIRFLHAFR